LGLGVWGMGDGPHPPIPNPQSPIPNPQKPEFRILIFIFKIIILYKFEKLAIKKQLNFKTQIK
jgi:hypothetical protein